MNEVYPLVYRRAYKRYTLNDPVHLFTLDGKEALLSLKNVSGSGACVYGNHPFKENEFVTITIQATSPFFQGLSNREARVAWSRQVTPVLWEAGLDFKILG